MVSEMFNFMIAFKAIVILFLFFDLIILACEKLRVGGPPNMSHAHLSTNPQGRLLVQEFADFL